MIILSIDKHRGVPAYRQILEQVRQLVNEGVLAPGDRLPPSRVLARTAGVHRSTVVRAYGELWALGYLESRPGSYSTVRRPERTTSVARSAGGTTIDWHARSRGAVGGAVRDAARLAGDLAVPSGVIDFATLAADPALSPVDDLRRCLKTVLRERGRQLLDYGDALGYLPLRQTLARRMRVHGVTVGADEMLITGGAQQGIDLSLRLLARAGDLIIVESPCYASALSLFRLHGLRIRSIPVGPHGMDLHALEAALKRERPALVYTMPNFQNPTGITTPQAHRERLLALCEARRVPIVEDGFEEEMKYFGRAVLPIKSMDTRGVVIYIGTLSKVVFPGLRVGWIAAPAPAIEHLAAIQRASCLGGSPLVHAAAERFCSSGRYEAYLRRAHTVYRRRMQAMLRGLAQHMPRGTTEWTEPSGGYTVWVRVDRPAGSEADLAERFLRSGVKVTPGAPFFPTPPATSHFRLSIGRVGEDAIAEGCRRLGGACHAALARRRRAPARTGAG